MKAAEFDYARAGTVEEVCRLLDGAHGDGKIIAGGQTLVPLMAMRLTRPSLVIDINRIAELHGIDADDRAASPSRQRHARPIRSPMKLCSAACRCWPRRCGWSAIRRRASAARSAAASPMPIPPPNLSSSRARSMRCITARSTAGTRKIAMARFFAGAMTTALAAEECLTGVRFPVWQDNASAPAFTK